MEIKFVKMNVFGNDFIIIDNRDGKFNRQAQKSEFVKTVCQRKVSIGADGCIFFEKSNNADMKMVFYNCDGSEAEMCGNGVRCLAYSLFLSGICGKKVVIETRAGNVTCHIYNSEVGMEFPWIKDLKLDIEVYVDGKKYLLNYISVGVPHVVYFLKDIETVDVKNIGRKIRFHERFSPDGVNVNFVKILGKNRIEIRTYERGVEDETFSCGTGAIASAVISAIKRDLNPPIKCETYTGGNFKVTFKKNKISNINLISKITTNFKGTIEYNL